MSGNLVEPGFQLRTWDRFAHSAPELEPADFSVAIRGLSIEMSGQSGTAHLGSVLSCADILSTVFRGLGVGPGSQSARPGFVLSKGHAALGLYASLLLTGEISEQEFRLYSKLGSPLEEHPSIRVPSVLSSTGSLGHGLGFMAGRLQGLELMGQAGTGIVLMSDGECNEGTVWEAALYASTKEIAGLVVVVDFNGFQATGPSSETFGRSSIAGIFQGFGWAGEEIDGHNISGIHQAISTGLSQKSPYYIIANTVKGRGVSFMEADNNWHYRSPNAQEVDQGLLELGIV